ncbi:MAG: flagellar biosynthesis protein FlhB [Phycisphaerales bacterium]|nr:flagellar biosynthesis protein FlhB [Planctomycetota bacterium]MCH8508522.1 flagellar biosynthesis protein FlhB [Phycisphaerales bacterium]
MADDLGERSEAPTSKRRSEARDKGQIPKSQDLSGVITLFGSMVILIAFGGMIISSMAGMIRAMLTADASGVHMTVPSMAESARQVFGQAALILIPVLAVAALFGFVSQFIQVGWNVTPEPIRPKLNKLDPIKGFKRVFGKRGLMKTVMNTIKLTVVIGVAYLLALLNAQAIASLPALTAAGALTVGARLLVILMIILLALMLLIALIDYMYQRWQHTQDLKMTKQQVKDERRSMEGDPQIKGKRMQMAREIAMQRVGQAVPEADVVITNPTHFSVAIKYESGVMNAPRLTAKGADEIALRIRQLARKHDVPIVERPPLARAIYWGVEIGQEIAPEHYEAVAEILAYVYRLDGRAPARPDQKTRPDATNKPVPAGA